MQRHKIVRKASVGVLLFLPLVAVGIAVALMLSLGHQGVPTAQADTTENLLDISMTTSGGPAGSTDCSTKDKSKCSYPAGSEFNLSIDINEVTGVLAPGYQVGQMLIVWDGTFVDGPDGENGKGLFVTAKCGITATAIDPGAVANSASATCNAPVGDPTFVKMGTGLPRPQPDAGVPPVPQPDLPPADDLAFVEFNCLEEGTGFIILIKSLGQHPAGASSVADEFGQPHFDKSGSQVMSVNCLPPDGQININVVDASLQSQKLSGSCWLISTDVVGGTLSEPVTINKPVDIVSDNNAQAVCDGSPGAPFKADLSDKNPATGQIDITISGQNRLDFGDIWHISQVKADSKYAADSTKYTCVLTSLVGPKPNGNTGCAFFDGPIGPEPTAGVGTLLVTNDQVNGNLTVNFELNTSAGNFPLGPEIAGNDVPDDVVCINIATFGQGDLGDFCTTNGSSTIVTNLVAPDLVKVTFLGCPEPLAVDDKDGTNANPVQLALGHAASGEKQISADFSCAPTKVLNLKTPGAANLFLTNQTGKGKPDHAPDGASTQVPASCRSGTDVALFTHALSIEPASFVPKATIDKKTGVITPSDVVQRVAAFSMDVSVKPEQASLVCLNIVPGDYFYLTGTGNNPFAGLSGQALVEAVQARHNASDPVAGEVEGANLGSVVCFIDDVDDGSEPKGSASIGCVTKGKGFDRIEVSVGKSTQFFKIATIQFQCQTTGEIVQGLFKDHIKDANPGEALPDHEVWGGTFSDKCIGGVDILATPVESSNAMVIKEAEIINTTTGLTAAIICKNIAINGWRCGDAPVDQTLPMAYILVKPDPDLYSLLKADQENGVVVQILNSQCNFADSQGHRIPTSNCPDSDLTIRRLEADVNSDCQVDAIDQQLLAFRWGADFGSLLYQQQYDLVDTGVATINIKDVQFVFGRHGSKCTPFNQEGLNGPAHPEQPPVVKK